MINSCSAGWPAVKTKPVPTTNPSPAQLARGINDVHACLEDARGDITLIKLALGIDKDVTEAEAETLVPRFKTHWDAQTIFTAIGAVGGGLLLFKIIAAVAPAAWNALLNVS